MTRRHDSVFFFFPSRVAAHAWPSGRQDRVRHLAEAASCKCKVTKAAVALPQPEARNTERPQRLRSGSTSRHLLLSLHFHGNVCVIFK